MQRITSRMLAQEVAQSKCDDGTLVDVILATNSMSPEAQDYVRKVHGLPKVQP